MDAVLPRRRVSKQNIVLLIACLALGYRLIVLLGGNGGASRRQRSAYEQAYGYDRLHAQSWRALSDALQAARPAIDSFASFTPLPGKDAHDPNSSDQPDAVQLTKDELRFLQNSHSKFMQRLDKDPNMRVIYRPGTRGIVFTAGRGDLAYLLISLRLLRKTGSKLPVEVSLPNQSDYDEKLCSTVLPQLDAHCTVLAEHLALSPMPTMPQTRDRRGIRAQEPLHKMLAIYASSFEDVLMLDASTLVYNNPDSTLQGNPFRNGGLILWPDFWASSVSPTLHRIQDRAEGTMFRIDGHLTVDLGQIAISKKNHGQTLLLAIYYNCFGPRLFDLILQQGAIGEHGAQAIKSAAKFLRQPYYTVKRPVEAVGFPDLTQADHGFRGVAMRQSSPADDFHRVENRYHQPLFVRQNNPSLHPAFILQHKVTVFEGIDASQYEALRSSTKHQPTSHEESSLPYPVPARPPTNEDNGVHHRLWEWFDARDMDNGWGTSDAESAVWAEVAQIACSDYQLVSDWPYQFESSNRLNCDRINYHRAQLGWIPMAQ